MNRFIIDGFNLLYRSHYAFQKFSTSTGLLSGAIYGFFTTLRSLRKRFSNCKFYVAWDNEAVSKKAALPEYKANRVSSRISLPINDLKSVLKGLSVVQVECPNEEADDVISSIVFQSNSGIDYIYSSDKDLLQLVRDGKVVVVSPKVGAIPEKFYDEGAIKAKWGVGPIDLACLFAFKGDSSDNIPGTSVPSKVLASLSSKYKNLETVYSNLSAEKLTDFQKKALIDNRNQVFLNYSIILLKNNLDCVHIEGKSDPEKLKTIFDKYEIKTLSPESFVEMFDSDTVFLHRTNPCLKTVSMF